MFLVLAFVFGGGFVFFGVGSGSTGIGDLFRGDFGGIFSHSGGSSISKLEKEAAKHPKDAQAWRKLATALEGKQREEDAIAPLEQYTRLRPKDANALQELAGLYRFRAQRYIDLVQAIDADLASVSGTAGVLGLPQNSFLVQEQQKNPLYTSIIGDLNSRRNDALTQLQIVLRSREDAYQRAVEALPGSDTGLPGAVFAWAQSAEQAQDYKTALKAYRRYLSLAPDSGLAPDARKAIKRIKQILGAQAVSPSGGG